MLFIRKPRIRPDAGFPDAVKDVGQIGANGADRRVHDHTPKIRANAPTKNFILVGRA